jgi:hypothetical protein
MPPEDRRDFVKGISCPKCRKRIPEHAEKERALSSLIETLNQIEAEVRQILATLRSPKGISSIRDADSLAGAFFYSCQIGEERIRTARKKIISPTFRSRPSTMNYEDLCGRSWRFPGLRPCCGMR